MSKLGLCHRRVARICVGFRSNVLRVSRVASSHRNNNRHQNPPHLLPPHGFLASEATPKGFPRTPQCPMGAAAASVPNPSPLPHPIVVSRRRLQRGTPIVRALRSPSGATDRLDTASR